MLDDGAQSHRAEEWQSPDDVQPDTCGWVAMHGRTAAATTFSFPPAFLCTLCTRKEMEESLKYVSMTTRSSIAIEVVILWCFCVCYNVLTLLVQTARADQLLAPQLNPTGKRVD